MGKKSEEAKNEATRENLRLILQRGDARTRQAVKELIADAPRQVGR